MTQEYTTIPTCSRAYQTKVYKLWHTIKAQTIQLTLNGKPKATNATRINPEMQPFKLICAKNTMIMRNPNKSITFSTQPPLIRKYLFTGFLVVMEGPEAVSNVTKLISRLTVCSNVQSSRDTIQVWPSGWGVWLRSGMLPSFQIIRVRFRLETRT